MARKLVRIGPAHPTNDGVRKDIAINIGDNSDTNFTQTVVKDFNAINL